MKCSACKEGVLKPGTTVIPYVNGKVHILVKDVDAMICDQCGAWLLNPETLESVQALIQREADSGHEISVVSLKKAA